MGRARKSVFLSSAQCRSDDLYCGSVGLFAKLWDRACRCEYIMSKTDLTNAMQFVREVPVSDPDGDAIFTVELQP